MREKKKRLLKNEQIRPIKKTKKYLSVMLITDPF